MAPELLSGKSQVAKYVKSFIHGLSGKYIFQRHLTFTTATACKLKSLILLAIASLFVYSIRIVHYSRPIFLGNYVRPAIIPRLSKNFSNSSNDCAQFGNYAFVEKPCYFLGLPIDSSPHRKIYLPKWTVLVLYLHTSTTYLQFTN